MDKLLVTFLGSALIVFIYIFFFFKKEKIKEVSGDVDIIAKGGYRPQVIAVKRGDRLKLNFRREDPSGCLEEIVFSDYGIQKHLPLKETVSIEFPTSKPGEYLFSCGMRMYHGKIIVF